MVDNYLSGKQGSVLVGTIAYSFGKWKIPMKTKVVSISNFNTVPYEAFVACLTGATLTLEGPYNEGNMPLTCGNSYPFTLGFTSIIGIAVTAIVNELTPDNDAEGAPRINVTATVNGAFTAAIL